MDAHISVYTRTVQTDVHPKGDARPCRVTGLAIKALLQRKKSDKSAKYDLFTHFISFLGLEDLERVLGLLLGRIGHWMEEGVRRGVPADKLIHMRVHVTLSLPSTPVMPSPTVYDLKTRVRWFFVVGLYLTYILCRYAGYAWKKSHTLLPHRMYPAGFILVSASI